MKTETARDLLTLSPAQGAYALALSVYKAARFAAEALKIERGVDYTKADTEEAIDAMCDIEGQCEKETGVLAAERALRVAETGLMTWAFDRLSGLTSPEDAATLRDLQSRADRSVVARQKVVNLCFRLAV